MACLVDFAGVFIAPLLREDEFGREGWFWFLHDVTPDMALRAYRKRARVAERKTERDFQRIDSEMARVERAIKSAPERQARRLATQLDQRRRAYDCDVRRAYFRHEVNRRIVAAIEDGQLARSTVALARISQGVAKSLPIAKLKAILGRYKEAQEQQHDSYSIFDELLVDKDDRIIGENSSARSRAVDEILLELRAPPTSTADPSARPKEIDDDTIGNGDSNSPQQTFPKHASGEADVDGDTLLVMESLERRFAALRDE